ncbi:MULTISPECIES: elongation factor G [Clostridium]|uniref:elongation factor G n=1 Tax=Clostridium TaxID=1485 RepID=UPI00082484AB|nr:MULTISPECIES: TetM/TetW/TetO/TetS family tetracycline resistance ribosomal protection protein [Clostridium]PJI07493.1 elongation factor G [Clostridium sp. CT7]
MNKTIGLLAHVDAGKTTFAEQILYHTKSIRKRGRVDHKDSFLDNNSVERERGITVFSEQAIFNYKDCTYFLIDTPGHVDFSTEMERSIKVMDYAILIISGADGVQSQTEIIWQLLRKYKVPTIFFINKMDRVGSDSEKVIDEIKRSLTKDIFHFEGQEMSQDIIEFIAERDDNICEIYLNSGYEKDLWMSSMKKMINKNKIFPCFTGSALEDSGIDYFLEKLHMITYTKYNSNEDFCGLVYKIKHDKNKNKIVYMKAVSGNLSVKQEIKIKGEIEKPYEIRFYNGEKYSVKSSAEAGELFAVLGINNVAPGEFIGTHENSIKYNLVPALKSKVIFDEKINPKEVLECFRLLEEEDPSLNVFWNEKFQNIEIHIMGKIQLEILKSVLLDRFNMDIDFGSCEVLYKETIAKETMGYGHFEPLRHYAEVHLRIEPALRNSGITFSSKCSTDNLTVGEQNLIRTHIFEKEHKGILTGSVLTDLKITLVTGRHHIKHTSGGDFREATLRALRQGLESTENILLEPFYKFKIQVDINLTGRVLSDINRMHGEFDAPQTIGNSCFISGRGPVSEFMDYPSDVASFTKGKGKISFVFEGYDVCHNEEKIIKDIGYNKNADIEYTSTSIFCSKGQAYKVSWDKAKNFMHCLK